MDNSSYLNSFEKIIIYYDNGQNLITKTINATTNIINNPFNMTGNISFSDSIIVHHPFSRTFHQLS